MLILSSPFAEEGDEGKTTHILTSASDKSEWSVICFGHFILEEGLNTYGSEPVLQDESTYCGAKKMPCKNIIVIFIVAEL
jgi:hypothetical protein